jgi:vacuolar-type H+-ATPase subunit H
MKKLENMDENEIMEAWTAAAEVLEEQKAKVKEFSDEFKRRQEEAAARERYENMNDAERAALLQVFEVEGIESKESVNNG